MSLTARTFFTPEQQEDIRQAIMNAELDTSGEIRVHIELNCPGDPVNRAVEMFHELNMHETENHNGIMIYLAVENRKFAIMGDNAIHEKVTDYFWESAKNTMLEYFRNDRFTEGLVQVITQCGQQLKEYFPYQVGDKNELPDDISFDE